VLLLLFLLFSLPPLLARPHSCSPHPLTLSVALIHICPSCLPSFVFATVAAAAGATIACPHSSVLAAVAAAAAAGAAVACLHSSVFTAVAAIVLLLL